MHEYAVTEGMLRQVLAEAERHGRARVARIHLLVGESAGVVPECVRHYFSELRRGTLAEGAELDFQRVPLVLRCPKCRREFSGVDDMCACNSGADIVSGQEMVVESVELADDGRPDPGTTDRRR